MKILVLTNNDIGLYNFRKELLQQLIQAGNEVYISLPYGEKVKLLEDMGCIYIKSDLDRRGINPLTDIRLFIRYLCIIKSIKPDKVITYTIKPNIYGCLACRLKKVKAYANITGLGTAFQGDGLLNRLVTFMYKIALKKVEIVFFENKGNRDIIVHKNIIEKEKTCCLNGAGVNLQEYPFTEYPEEGSIRFLFIGRVMKEKGIDELFEAAERIKQKYENVYFDIVGPIEDHYEDKLRYYEEKKVIAYHGLQTDVKPFIRESHCFVLPSYHEGMANTLLESGAMGRPLITSNIHGCLEAVEDGKTGYLCNVKDADDLYIKIEQFIELPYEKKKEMGKLSHEHVADVFDKWKVVEKTIGYITAK